MSNIKSTPINVCIINHFGYHLFNRKCKETRFGGGAEVQLYLLSKNFAKNRDLQVNVITGNYKITKNRVELFQNLKLYNVLPIERKIINYFKALIIFFFTLKYINPDVIIQRTADVTSGLSAFYCKLFRKKFIFSIANKTDVNGNAERGFKGKIYKYGINNASFIVAQSIDQIIELQAYKKRKFHNIKVIRSGYEINSNKFNIKEIIFWVARCVKWKRPEIFLKLAKKFPNEKFIMVLNKREDKIYWNEIYKDASRIPNLKSLDFVPFYEIGEYFERTRIFINTSLTNEGFPNTFIQAFKNKIPIISLNVNPDQILTKNRIGFYCNGDFEKMENYLKLLLDNPNLYKSYSENAYNYVKEYHDIKNISKEWILLIKWLYCR